MTSPENQQIKKINYFKVLIKLSLIFFLLSVLILGTIKLFAKKKLNNPAEVLPNEVSEVELEKSIADFEKSEMFQKIFKNDQKAIAGTTKQPIPTLPDNQIPEESAEQPTPPPVEAEEKIAEVVTIPEQAEEVQNVPAPVVTNKIFDFEDGRNYQKVIADYIASNKLPNLNADELATIIITESQAIKINPIITAVLISQESQFNRYAENANGRVGLLQIHPNEAREITKKIDLPFLGTISLYHPIYNIRLGLHLLLSEKEALGSWEAAVKKFSKLKNPQQANQYLEKVVAQAEAEIKQ